MDPMGNGELGGSSNIHVIFISGSQGIEMGF